MYVYFHVKWSHDKMINRSFKKRLIALTLPNVILTLLHLEGCPRDRMWCASQEFRHGKS